MNIPFVDLHAQYLRIKPEIDAAISDVITHSHYIRGPHVERFEKNWAEMAGVKNCVSCANGTDAIYILLRGLGLPLGSEVITTAHSWISTTETITQAGGRVVFCDTDSKNFTIDPNQIEAKITDRTVGIIPVHLYGHPADMTAIMAIAKRHNLWVIEDCAQSHLAMHQGQITGTFGRAATFSFYPGKNLGAYGDAGAIGTNDDSLASWCAMYARHGGKGDHMIEGINSRLDGLQAAILNAKMPHLPLWTSERQRVAAAYNRLLEGVGDLELPQVTTGNTHVYHLYVIRTARRDALKKHLEQNGIATVINYPKALPFYPAYSYLGHKPSDFPIAYSHQSRILSLPIYPEATDDQIARVANSITEFFSR